MEARPTVFIIDEDPGARQSLMVLLSEAGFKTESYDAAQDFLDHYDPNTRGCVLVQARMPDMTGPEFQQELRERAWATPVIILGAQADVSTVLPAVRAGATAILGMPLAREEVLKRVHQAIEQDAAWHREHARVRDARARLSALTARERQVMELVVAGKTTQDIGRELNISPRTIDKHREHLMQKMKVRSLPELGVIAVHCGLVKRVPEPADTEDM